MVFFSTNVHITGPQKRQPFWSPHHQDETPRIDWNSLVSLLVSLASSASKQIGSKIIQDPCLEIELYWTCSIIQFVCRLTQTQIGNKQIGYKIDQKCICLEVTIWMIKVHISLFCTKQFLNSQSQPFRCSNAAVEAWRRLQTVEKSLGRNLFLQGCLLQNVIQCVLQSKLIVFLGQWRHYQGEIILWKRWHRRLAVFQNFKTGERDAVAATKHTTISAIYCGPPHPRQLS